MEDCSSVLMELWAKVLGMSVEGLIGYLTSGILRVDMSDQLAQYCLKHDSTTAQVQIKINGQIVNEYQISLQTKGEYKEAAHIIRQSGHFTIK